MELRQQSFRIHVSIQLLLLFYDYGNQYYPPWRFVSIQLLLLFYEYGKILWTDGLPFQYNFCYCSMPLIPLFIKGHLRFNTAFVIVLSAPEFAQNELLTLFQYSFCYCSIYLLIGVKILVKVSIQLLLLFYIFCRGWYAIFIRVSIQLLLLFYYATFNDYEWDNGFQYNFCYCSMISRARPVYIMYRFQYNFCYCSISRIYRSRINSTVSIQLLLLFYTGIMANRECPVLVSIQLLLLFYLYLFINLIDACAVSIQLLLLFYHPTKWR